MSVYSRTYYDDPVVPPKEDGEGDLKTFTPEQQQHIDKIVQTRLRKQKAEQDKLLSQLQELQQSKNLSDTEKATLEQQIEDLRSTSMTKEEILAKDKKELSEKHQKELKKVQDDASVWQNRYTESTIERALVDAAIESSALRPKQIVELFKGKTRLVEDSKNPGQFVPQMKFEGKDADGKPIILDLPVKDAMTQIKGMVDEYGNLFKSDANGGLGMDHNSSGSTGFGNLKSTEAYIAARRKGLTLEQIGKVGV